MAVFPPALSLSYSYQRQRQISYRLPCKKKNLIEKEKLTQLSEDAKIKPGAKADPKVISELLQQLKMYIAHF